MLTYERFILSFLGAPIPEEAMIRGMRIDHEHEKIVVAGMITDDHQNIISQEWDIPFHTGKLQDNDSDNKIIDVSYEIVDDKD